MENFEETMDGALITISATNLRRELSKFLSIVEKGAVIVITQDENPVAVMVPYEA